MPAANRYLKRHLLTDPKNKVSADDVLSTLEVPWKMMLLKRNAFTPPYLPSQHELDTQAGLWLPHFPPKLSPRLMLEPAEFASVGNVPELTRHCRAGVCVDVCGWVWV